MNQTVYILIKTYYLHDFIDRYGESPRNLEEIIGVYDTEIKAMDKMDELINEVDEEVSEDGYEDYWYSIVKWEVE